MTNANGKRALYRATTVGLILALLIAGCARGLKSETIVISDAEEEAPAGNAGDPFQVETIYRLPPAGSDNIGLAAWQGGDRVVRMLKDESGAQSLVLLKPPYEDSESLPMPNNFDIYGFAPNGKRVYGIQRDVGKYGYALFSWTDKTDLFMETFEKRIGGIKRIGWTNDGRYASYLIIDDSGKEASIGVYDAIEDKATKLAFPEWLPSSSVVTVKLSDDGKSAIIAESERDGPRFRIGRLNGSGYAGDEYAHPLGEESQATWLDNDRVLFSGTDGTLFVYDRRNKAKSVLADGVGSFELSKDRQAIAYLKDKADVRVANLQGNNLLNDHSVYQGVVPLFMSWSPDNGKLLIQGRKPYETEPRPAEQAPSGSDTPLMVIEFKR